MKNTLIDMGRVYAALLLSIVIGASTWAICDTVLEIKQFERSVSVKGLAEREVNADTVIWPLKFNDADNDLERLMSRVEQKNQAIIAFLKLHGFDNEELTTLTPSVTDKLAQAYSQGESGYRFVASSGISVYSHKVAQVISAKSMVSELAKQGVALNQDRYETQVEFIFSNLNTVKPDMVKEATEKARQVALQFANDSQSVLGKIKSARQGQFSISDRDSTTPHIKKVRVVTSVEYYLSD